MRSGAGSRGFLALDGAFVCFFGVVFRLLILIVASKALPHTNLRLYEGLLLELDFPR